MPRLFWKDDDGAVAIDNNEVNKYKKPAYYYIGKHINERHAGLDPASSHIMDSRLRENENGLRE
ncbi:MAG: hypothetical protein CSYNP_03158 [Syntrophus sp. SKADARSKE-3]|nr:hypothetical protein [Syntrophus sp. SKADARSKE-3]